MNLICHSGQNWYSFDPKEYFHQESFLKNCQGQIGFDFVHARRCVCLIMVHCMEQI